MPDRSAHVRAQEFRNKLLHWIVVHHLLPANLLRELASTMVACASEDRLSLDQLLEELRPQGPMATSSWFVASAGHGDVFADHLSRLVMTMIWRGDEIPFPPQTGLGDRDAGWIRALHAALALSSSDLSTAPAEMSVELEPVRDLVDAMSRLRDAVASESLVEAVSELRELDHSPVLRGLLAKHMGDLCGDADRWDLASAFYGSAERALAEPADEAWTEFTGTVRDLVCQSRGMAALHIDGPQKAVAILDQLLSSATLREAPLPVLNATFDLLHARVATEPLTGSWTERRAAALITPQLLSSLDLENALTYSENAKFRDAHRWFWATLRRQTALGGATDSRRTKGYYGRSVIEEVAANQERYHLAEQFALGVRLLVEGGQTEPAERTRWTESLVDAYLNSQVLDQLKRLVGRAPGVSVERTMVVTVLYREWLAVLPAESDRLAADILRALTQTATTGNYAGLSNVDTGGLALKALGRIGTERPEFRHLVGGALVEAVDVITGRWGPLPVSEAIETAAIFVDGLEPEVVEALAFRVMDLVDRLQPEAFWPVIRAASRLLGSDAVARFAATNDRFARRRSHALIRLALNSQSEHTSLMYLLRDVDPSVIDEQVDAEALQGIVAGLRERARDTASSGATAYIHALLVAPKVSSAGGIEDALAGLATLIGSAIRHRPAPAFQNGYEPVLLLAAHGDSIAADLGIAVDAFHTRLAGLLDELAAMWRVAAQRPLIFAGFSIPPRSAPDRVTVHNWTFATLAFARSLGREDLIEPLIDAAQGNDALKDAISVARAVQTTAAAGQELDLDAVGSERPNAFYAALGQRLLDLSNEPAHAASDKVRVLLGRCMEVGPRGEDAALLLAAHGRGIRLDPTARIVTTYLAKIRGDQRLRLTLSPLLQGILEAKVH